jgi:hypothetical protein
MQGDKRWLSTPVSSGLERCTSLLHHIQAPTARYREELQWATGAPIRTEFTCVTCHIAMLTVFKGMQ